jgi:uncharacterized protein (TIGR00369 family)
MQALQFEASNRAFADVVRTHFAQQGLMTLYGASLTEITPGRVVIDLPTNPALIQHQGRIHGGVIGAIADSAGGFAALTLMPAGSDVVTVEYKINFMRAATGHLRAIGEVIRPGKTITVARMICESGTPGALETCAVVQATFMRVAPAG